MDACGSGDFSVSRFAGWSIPRLSMYTLCRFVKWVPLYRLQTATACVFIYSGVLDPFAPSIEPSVPLCSNFVILLDRSCERV